jgi:putative endopeptidase
MGVARSRIARVSRMAFLLAAVSPLVATVAMAEDTAAAASDGIVHFGTWGVDLTSRDMSVRPGDDFQRYAAGKWLDANPIPADKSSNSIGSEVNDRNQERLRSIVMSAPKNGQLGALFASYMDEARLEQLDAAPLKADLAKVDAIKSKAEFTHIWRAR